MAIKKKRKKNHELGNHFCFSFIEYVFIIWAISESYSLNTNFFPMNQFVKIYCISNIWNWFLIWWGIPKISNRLVPGKISFVPIYKNLLTYIKILNSNFILEKNYPMIIPIIDQQFSLWTWKALSQKKVHFWHNFLAEKFLYSPKKWVSIFSL